MARDAAGRADGDVEVVAAATTPDGWFRTGDLAVVHADGYVEIRDRTKDSIVSGGENISSVEVVGEVVFGELPRTSTGKIQKHVLRDT